MSDSQATDPRRLPSGYLLPDGRIKCFRCGWESLRRVPLGWRYSCINPECKAWQEAAVPEQESNGQPSEPANEQMDELGLRPMPRWMSAVDTMFKVQVVVGMFSPLVTLLLQEPYRLVLSCAAGVFLAMGFLGLVMTDIARSCRNLRG